MSLLKLPYTNLHELNLDWIIEQLNQEGAVLSVNGKHGTVTLTAEDIERTPNNPQTVEQALTAQGTSIQTARNEIGVLERQLKQCWRLVGGQMLPRGPESADKIHVDHAQAHTCSPG